MASILACPRRAGARSFAPVWNTAFYSPSWPPNYRQGNAPGRPWPTPHIPPFFGMPPLQVVNSSRAALRFFALSATTEGMHTFLSEHSGQRWLLIGGGRLPEESSA